MSSSHHPWGLQQIQTPAVVRERVVVVHQQEPAPAVRGPWLPKRPTARTIMGLVLIVFTPFAFAAAAVYLLGLAARMAWGWPRPDHRQNATPCGYLCRHAVGNDWNEWSCRAHRNQPCDESRRLFSYASDPNNCSMFERRV